jgi:O-acetyl-ADP-ribose deacetylase (regulator of RNase III)
MQLILVDPSRDFAAILTERFRSNPEVKIVCGRFEDLPEFDCVVTAGNSFGLMDAGMDLAVVRYFGEDLMHRIQKAILDDFLGEQPVGTCLLIETRHLRHPFVAHAPTMRVPMNIQGTDRVYLAMWSVLTTVHRHNRTKHPRIESLACPGLGTGTGGMDLEEAALQLYLAYIHYLRPPTHLNPSLAQRRHEKVYYGGRWGFLNPRSAPPLDVT